MSGAEGPFMRGERLTKAYGPVQAIVDVDLDVRLGEVLALIGDNGAGKTTLVRMLSGAVTPDSGRILVEGRPVAFRGPRDARAAGVETIFQDLALLENLDVTTNMFLGRELCVPRLDAFGLLSRKRMQDAVRERLDDLRIHIPNVSGVPVGRLSGGQRQSIAIARAVFWARKIIVMDEPTAALGVRQARAVLELITRIRDHGIGVVLVSHAMPHVLAVSDRVAVLRHGRLVADLPAGGLTQDRLIEHMIGSTAPDDIDDSD